MSEAFAHALAKFCIVVLAFVALLALGVGILILFFPHIVWTVITYAVGIGLLFLGLAAGSVVLYSLVASRAKNQSK